MTYEFDYGAGETGGEPQGRRPRREDGEASRLQVRVAVVVATLFTVAAVGLFAAATFLGIFGTPAENAGAAPSVDVELAALDAAQEVNRDRLEQDLLDGLAAVEAKNEADRIEAERVAREAAEAEAARLAAEQAAAAAATTTTAPPPQPTSPPAAPAEPPSFDGSVWDALAQCESNGNWGMNSGNGFYGGIQFMHQTWVNMGGRDFAEYPHEATREQQIVVAERLLAAYGWGQWPACSSKLGLR